MGIHVGVEAAVPPTDRPRNAPWLVPPVLRTTVAEEGERHATWLELFFDLVFVVAITEAAQVLVADHSTLGFLRFAGLFVPVWVAWQGYMAYADRFDTDDVLFRVALLTAMLAIAAMAVLIPDVARGVHTVGFAVAYAVLRSIMVALYGRAWRSVPEARPLIRRYGIGYSIGIAIWLVSVAVPTPYRYAVWGVALVFELSLPPLSVRIHRRIPVSGSHLPERWALFTLIVIAESIASVALSVSGAQWRLESVVAAVLGFVVVAAVWWLYFDRQSHVVLRGTPAPLIYSYAHLPLLIALAAVSAGVRLMIAQAGADHLDTGARVALLGGVALYALSLIGTRSVTATGSHRLGVSLKLGSVAAVVGLLSANAALTPVAVAGVLAGILVALVVLERVLIPLSSPAS
jgi:low temperature requirement protein LtrA